jgi:arsenate reductase
MKNKSSVHGIISLCFIKFPPNMPDTPPAAILEPTAFRAILAYLCLPDKPKSQILSKIFPRSDSPMNVTLYHKPTCGTCQKVLKALQDKGAQVTAVEYLKTPPSEKELDAILKKLNMDPLDLVRKKEPLYQEKYADKNLSRAQWLKILHENPILIERPVVVMEERAVVARPPERLTELFK